MLQRMIGAAMLNASVFEEIEADRGALPQAIGVVILVTLCGIVGGIIGNIIEGDVQPVKILVSILNGGLFGLLRWALWVTLIYVVGGLMLKTATTETSWAELGRVVGFAYTPVFITLFSFLPQIGNLSIGALMQPIAFVWTLVAVVIAIRHALDFEGIGRAILVALITGIIGIIPLFLLKFVEWVIT